MSDLARKLRVYEPRDEAFVFNSWLVSLWEGSSYLHWLEKKRVLHHWHSQLERIVSPQSVRVACSPEMPSQILGWICSEGELLHYCYVKELYREQDIASDLWRAAGEPRCCTFWTPYASTIADQHVELTYRPWRLIRRLKDEAAQIAKAGTRQLGDGVRKVDGTDAGLQGTGLGKGQGLAPR